MGDEHGANTFDFAPAVDDYYDDPKYGADPHANNGYEEAPDDPYGEQDNPRILGQILKRSELSSLPEVKHLVDKVLSRPATCVLVGGYGVGKTFLALSLAASVATGRPWLGRDVHRARTLYILGEGAYGIDHRLLAWEAACNSGQAISDDDLTFVVQPNSLAKGPTWDAITAMAVDHEYKFVICDTFSSLAPDADETKDAAMIMRRLSNLATAIEGTALLVHHPGWSDASRTRGGYQFEANADEVLVATELAEGSDVFTLLRKKVKDGPDGDTLYIRRMPIIGSIYLDEADPTQAGIPMRLRVLQVLGDLADVGATGKQLMDELGVEDKGRSAFYKAMNKLRDDEQVVERGQKNRPRYYLTHYAPDPS